ncbi:hypothetical protein CERZMDRAFT_112821 [Cercospora zeae-maydis SCOH1-5]|uniref:FAD-binding domain-containing protein n=1 Tax=Cercospora zeae-maydis SCOH1-5 TaxID=717836 RepID=A0A6A6FBY5_9PEZI|nr:hypothetical protein CERZMDRAFT_112821 [Cercospora zeae-maydis SCOH1-5]
MAKNGNQNFHVAIVGAGIAGLALAIALHNKGIPFTLYEEAKGYSVVGAGVGFGPNGMLAMDLIEPGFRPLYEQLCVGNKGADAQHIFFEGMLVAQGLGLDKPWYGKSGWGHPDYVRKSAHRKTLLDTMTKFIPIENVQFNKRLVHAEEQLNGVSMTFADGTTATATVLAAADGIQSALREHVLRDQYPNEAAPVYADAYCYRAVIPISEARQILGDLTDVAKIYFGHNRSVVTYRISGGEEFNFLHCVADSEVAWESKDSVTEKTTYEIMMNDFEGVEIDDRVRQLLSKANPIKWGLFHHQHTSTYFRDRVVLTGDSAHASLPFQAAGASQGLEDALVLSNVLAELAQSCQHGTTPVSHIRAGLSAYDSVRRPRAQKQLDQAAEVGRMIFFEHEETGSDVNKILSKLQNGWFDWLWFHNVGEDVQKALNAMRKELSGARGT